MYLCKLIMQKITQILILTALMLGVACGGYSSQTGNEDAIDVVATVDGQVLLRSDIQQVMPKGLEGADSTTFVRMYIENWVLTKLKLGRAEQVLSSHQAEIDRLVEGYRQSLIMRQLDQYYIDNGIDLEITDQQLSAYYRSNAASFKLDHNKVRGVVVKAPRNFRNVSTLTTALKGIDKRGDAEEVRALCEKHNLQFTDLTLQWVPFSDFLSHLPTERSSSYDNLLGSSNVQTMKSDDFTFYFIIVDVVRKGEVAPLDCVREDISRRLYAERRAQIVEQYEREMEREAILSGRVTMVDSVLLNSMSYQSDSIESMRTPVTEVEEHIEEDVPSVDLSGVAVEDNSEIMGEL